MARLLIVGALFAAVFLVIQCVYILKTGTLVPFFVSQPKYARLPGRAARIGYAIFHLLIAFALSAILVSAVLKAQPVPAKWFADRGAALLGLVALFWVGVCALVRPSVVLRWAQHTYPQLSADDRPVLVTARFVGAGILALVLAILAFSRFSDWP
jgi:hypothetical protein